MPENQAFESIVDVKNLQRAHIKNKTVSNH